MLHVLFDYGLNVKLCVGAGVAQTLLWAAWVAQRRHPGRGRLLLFLVCKQRDMPSCAWSLTLP
jgi:hypothetical protein